MKVSQNLLTFLQDDVFDFTKEAACKNTKNPDRFFNKQAGVPTYCLGCPVRDKCLDYGISTGSVGWWGGVWLDDPLGSDDE